MFLELSSPNKLKGQIDQLLPTPGVYIFIDICGSTAIKQRNLQQWIVLIGNTFRLSHTFKLFRENTIKFIGDEMMIFIPDTEVEVSGEDYAQILSFLRNCVSPWSEAVSNNSMPTKAAIHYCADVYNVSFVEGVNDFYGTGVDFTARLMKKPEEGKIVMSESYYRKVFKIDPSFLAGISDRYEDEFKGIGLAAYWLLTT